MNFKKSKFNLPFLQGKFDFPKDYSLKFFRMAWPSALESVLVSLITTVDLMMVGTLGEKAISAVGITNQPRFILLAMVLSLNVGVTAIVARRKGEEDVVGANQCLRQSLIISFGLSFGMALLGFVFAKPLLLFAGAGSDYINISVEYFRIIMASIFFNGISLTINAAQRGSGNTKISLYTNISANIINLILNFLLINGIWFFPKLGVNGAGIATVIGSAVGCILSICSIFHKNEFISIYHKVGWKFNKKTMNAILNIGGASVAEQVFMRIGLLLYAKIVASLGTVAFAAHQICMSILSLSYAFGEGLGIASSALVGQSLGRKRADEAIIFAKAGQLVSFAISSVLFLIFLFGGKFLVSLFSSNAEIIGVGALIMVIVAATTHVQTALMVVSGCLRGAGDTKFVAISSLIGTTIIRPILTWLLCITFGMGVIGAWITILIDHIIRLAISFKRFKTGKWTKIDL